MQTAIVVPTNRPSQIKPFINKWLPLAKKNNSQIFIIEDSPRKTFSISDDNIIHASWREIDSDLRDKAWIIPRKTSAIRSYGFILAYRMNYPYIISLDDDCHPESRKHIDLHIKALNKKVPISWTTSWEKLDIHPRGFPYEIREEAPVVLNHGVWSGIPDLDAKTQKSVTIVSKKETNSKIIPKGCYFPMCGMNIAFKKELVPAMYFGLHGHRWPYDRFDDIWCGVILKRITDHLGLAITSGMPSVKHIKKSNININLKKESPGMRLNEQLWKNIDTISLSEREISNCYLELAQKLDHKPDTPYLKNLKKAMKIWVGLIN